MGENTAEIALDAVLALLGHFRLYQQYMLLLLTLLGISFGLLYHTYALDLQNNAYSYDNEHCENTTSPSAWDGSWDGSGCADVHYLHNHTLFAQLGLACRSRLREVLEVLQNCLQIVCMLLSGYLADRYGRRTSLLCTGVLAGTAALAATWGVPAVGLLLPALSSSGLHTAVVVAIECAMPSLRAVFSCVPRVAFGSGGVLATAGVLHLPAVVLAPGLALPTAAILLVECPRWLHAVGRTEQAVAVIKKAARWNKGKVPDDTTRGLHVPVPRDQRQSWNSVRRGVLLTLAAAAGGALAGCGDGTTSFTSDLAVDVTAAVDLTSAALAMMALQRWGRRGTAAGALCLAGAARAAATQLGGLALPALSRGAAVLSACGVALLSAEVTPTRERAQAVAVCGAAAVLADTALLLTKLTPGLVFWLSISAVGSAAVVLTPHDPRAPLPQHTARTRTPPPDCVAHL